jgi:hypothetical protein
MQKEKLENENKKVKEEEIECIKNIFYEDGELTDIGIIIINEISKKLSKKIKEVKKKVEGEQ